MNKIDRSATLVPAVGAQVQRGVRRWDRLLWGVEFTGSRTDDAPMLIGRMWATEWASSTPYPGEPTRALLFTTRELARQWCAETMAKWRDGRQRDDCVARWRVRAVRVRETVQVEAPNAQLGGWLKTEKEWA
jgi:hypothetical protein